MSKEMCCPVCGQYIDVDEIYQQGYEDGFASVKDLGKLYSEIRAEAIDECIKFIRENSSMHYIDCDGYFGGTEELIFNVDVWIDDLEQLKEKKND